MNTDRILPVNREHLLLMQVLCWLGPGIKVFVTGIKAMLQVNVTHPDRVWWLTLIAILVAVTFSLMFNNFIRRYKDRILNFLERKKSLFAFFDAHGYIMIIFFMCLGIGLKFVPGMPVDFFAGFYPGLGTALSIAGIRYLVTWCKAI